MNKRRPDPPPDWVSIPIKTEQGWRWVSWDEAQKPWYKKIKTQEHFTVHRHPFFWLFRTWTLHDAAEHLWSAYSVPGQTAQPLQRPRTIEFPSVALMLGGMAIENLFKAYLLSDRKLPIPVPDSALRKVTAGRHDLVALLEATRMRSNKSDRRMLTALSHYVRWDGRYPLPREQNELERRYTEDSHAVADVWAGYLGLRAKFEPRVRAAIGRRIR